MTLKEKIKKLKEYCKYNRNGDFYLYMTEYLGTVKTELPRILNQYKEYQKYIKNIEDKKKLESIEIILNNIYFYDDINKTEDTEINGRIGKLFYRVAENKYKELKVEHLENKSLSEMDCGLNAEDKKLRDDISKGYKVDVFEYKESLWDKIIGGIQAIVFSILATGFIIFMCFLIFFLCFSVVNLIIK